MMRPTQHGDQTVRVLFFGREDCAATLNVLGRLKRYGFDVTYVVSTRRGEKLPEGLAEWEGDYIICFRSLFILPGHLLDRAAIAAINFHPAPPEYPGSGCINFALYDGVDSYGVTAHLMNEKVDNGRILEVRRFPVHECDTLPDVLSRTHSELENLCIDFVAELAAAGGSRLESKLAACENVHWRGQARRMKDLEELQLVNPDIDRTELDRIVRATYVEAFPPKISLHGYDFYLRLDR